MLWPLSIAAALVFAAALMTGFPFGTRVAPLQIARNDGELRIARTPISIHVAYCAPTYTFRQEGGFVIDYLTCNPSVVEQTLWLSDNQKSLTIKPRTPAKSFE